MQAITHCINGKKPPGLQFRGLNQVEMENGGCLLGEAVAVESLGYAAE